MGAPASEVKLSTPNLEGSRISTSAEYVSDEQRHALQSICTSAVKHRDGATGRTGRMVEGSGCFKVWQAQFDPDSKTCTEKCQAAVAEGSLPEGLKTRTWPQGRIPLEGRQTPF